jgi:hypothetical protein
MVSSNGRFALFLKDSKGDLLVLVDATKPPGAGQVLWKSGASSGAAGLYLEMQVGGSTVGMCLLPAFRMLVFGSWLDLDLVGDLGLDIATIDYRL